MQQNIYIFLQKGRTAENQNKWKEGPKDFETQVEAEKAVKLLLKASWTLHVVQLLSYTMLIRNVVRLSFPLVHPIIYSNYYFWLSTRVLYGYNMCQNIAKLLA